MDKTAYEEKAWQQLQQPPFQLLSKDPMKKTERELNGILRSMNSQLYERLRTSDSSPALFYGLPKVHKPDVPLRPIVSSIGTATYPTSKYLATLLQPLTRKISSNIINTADFCKFLEDVSVCEDEILVSFDVKALYTSIPVNDALRAIQIRIKKDDSWSERTPLKTSQALKLLEFCLRSSTFKFRNRYYELTDGVEMGSPVSAPVANLYMEAFEEHALSLAPARPKVWKRFVDDVFGITKRSNVQPLLAHLNNQHDNIRFTLEEGQDGCLPFMDVLVDRSDQVLTTTVYRKPTHTERYLAFDSHHPLSVKHSVASSLYNRAAVVIKDQT